MNEYLIQPESYTKRRVIAGVILLVCIGLLFFCVRTIPASDSNAKIVPIPTDEEVKQNSILSTEIQEELRLIGEKRGRGEISDDEATRLTRAVFNKVPVPAPSN